MATSGRRSTDVRAAGLALAALAAFGVGRAGAQSVPAGVASAGIVESFERFGPDGAPGGFRLGPGSAIDTTVAYEGSRSLALRAVDGREARATLELAPPRVDGNRIRFSLRAQGADGADALDLFVRVDGADGLFYVDRRRLPLRAGAWQQIEIDAPRFDAAERLRFAVSIGQGTAFVDSLSIAGASTASLPPASSAARRYVDYALDLIDAHSIHRASVDWPAFRAAVLEQTRGAVTPSDAYLAVRYAIGELGDVHGYLRPPDRAEALGRAPVSNARTGRPPIPPEARLLPGGIGYLTVPGFAGGTHVQQVEFAETLQSMIRSLDDEAGGACGFIVDLRRNSGGNLWPMLLGLGPLLGDGDALHATYRDGRRESVWYRDGKAGLGDYARLRVRGDAYRLRGADARVALLIGADTASAGEVLAMAFRGVDGRQSFGAPTAGVNTGTRTFVMPDGAELVLAVVTMSDRTGRAYRGPIAPDVPAPSAPRGTPLEDQPDVRAALDWLRGGC